MNIIELIPYLKTRNKAELLSSSILPNIEYDLVELYMKNNLNLDSDIVFFDSESISNELIIKVNDIKYENLFPLYMAQELVEECVNAYNDELSNESIAKRLLEYRQKDAW